MLKIRLQRVGRKHEPKFRLVLTDSKNGPKSGRFLEVLGSYDARIDNSVENFNVEAIKAWIAKGAQLSDTVHNFLIEKKVLSGKKINALPKKTVQKKEGDTASAPAAAPVAASPAPASDAPVEIPAETPAPTPVQA